MKGEIGTEISLEIKRKTEEKPLIFTLKRRLITPPNPPRLEIPLSTFAPLSIFNVKENEESVKVGILTVPSFSKGISILVKEKLKLAKQKGVQSLILDLTGNSGRFYRTSCGYSRLFY